MRNKDNDYMLDRDMQRTHNYTGLPGNRAQDQAVTESMGTIMDRTTEHLGAADTAVIVMRRVMMRMARRLQEGIEPDMVVASGSLPDHADERHDRSGRLPGVLGRPRTRVQSARSPHAEG